MNAVNRILSLFGLTVSRRAQSHLTPEFEREFETRLDHLMKTSSIKVFRLPYEDTGDHPTSYMDFECAFASRHLAAPVPNSVLDIGSYRHFILGLLAVLKVTTLDVRKRLPASANETVITSDAKALDLPDVSFDVVVSLCAVEHFGLGRYGDVFDIEADRKALSEMIRVLKPGGRLIFTTTLTRADPSLAFNAHRIYSLEMIRKFCDGMQCIEEMYYSNELKRACEYEEITTDPTEWDVYLGCWTRK